MNELSSTQTSLLRQIMSHIAELKRYHVTKNDGQYLAFNNGKRFYGFNFDSENRTFFGIREDGDTRYVFNGMIENYDEFKIIDKCTMP